ncbi:MAG: peptidoglycan editing factor PgeF [Chlamydiia bacterium]|nr:peptidoglycan editing factor PgeF [Chlamydiia bacterium]HPE84758.1 peptidoglycan editing factor PgeF [Chlamydiales bacterium]
MIEKEKEGLKWLEFEQLQPFVEIKHGVFLRSPPFDDRTVLTPQKNAAEKLLGHPFLVLGKQVHKDHVAAIDVKPAQLLRVEMCDGCMTSKKEVGLLVRHADCQAVIFYDPVCQVIANVHCGWRGSVQGILPKTVRQMEKRYGCRPGNILVCISPSLGPNAAEFRNYQDELPETFYPFQIRPTYFDFWEISRFQLKQTGILDGNIEIAKLCTYSDPSRFYSYRQHKQCGFHLTCVSLGM